MSLLLSCVFLQIQNREASGLLFSTVESVSEAKLILRTMNKQFSNKTSGHAKRTIYQTTCMHV